MRLTIEEHGDRLDRFAHIRPRRGPGGRRCGRVLPGSTRACTREREHRGPHVSHNVWGKVLAAWEDEAGAALEPSTTAREIQRSSARARAPRPGSLDRDVAPGETATGPLAPIGRWFVKLLSSPEEALMVALFLGLVAWGLSVAWTVITRW